MELLSELKKYLNLASFRPGQEEVISTVVEGRDAVVVMPTGGGEIALLPASRPDPRGNRARGFSLDSPDEGPGGCPLQERSCRSIH